MFNCFPALDFSIHQEAIYRLANFESFNPYLLIRGINIFSDHFDPIIVLGIPFVWLFGFHPVGLLIFQMSWFVGMFYLPWKIYKKSSAKDKNLVFLFSLAIIVFSRGLIGGLVFPLHPVTWSMLPLLFLVYFLKEKNHKGVVFISLFLCFFKEIYPICIFFLSFYFLLTKDKKTFLKLLGISSVFLIFIFLIRPRIMGPIHPYASLILEPIFKDPLTGLMGLFKHLKYKEFFELFYPFFIPIFWVIKNEIWNKEEKTSHFFIPVLFFILPLLGVHFISNMIHNWNGVPFAATLIGVTIFSGFPQFLMKHKKLAAFCTLLFILSGSRHHSKAIKLLYFGDSKTCEISKKRYASLQNLKSDVSKIPEGKKIVATTGIIPWQMRPNRYFYHAGEYSRKLFDFDYMILERNHTGFITPYSANDIESFIKKCRGSKVITENAYYYLARGPFTKNCLNGLFSKWVLKPGNH